MTVFTWCTSERAAGLPIGRHTQRTGTRGKYSKCYAVDIEQKNYVLFVTVAAVGLKECLIEFRRTAANLGIPAEKWDKFDIPLTENSMRAVQAWAEEVRRTIKKSRKQAPADSPDAL